MKKPYYNGKATTHSIITFSEIKRRLKDLNPPKNPLYNKTSDISLGRLFADIFKDKTRYNTTAKSWYYYDGTIWKIDEGGMIVDRLAKNLSDALYIMCTDADQTYRTFVGKLGDRRKRLIMIEDAKEIYFISSDMLDSDGDLFNCQNGVLNLKTMEFTEHNSDYLLSKVSNVIYNPDTKSLTFEKFVSEIMCEDKSKEEYLQRVLGYSMTAENSQEECYMLYGATTRNGKSTLLETICYMMGDYALNMSPDTLASKPRDSRTASGDIARLDNCRLVHMSEPPKRMIFDVALIKTLLGRDKITARYLHQGEFEFTPIFKLLINTNYLPQVNDDTLFSSGRIKVIEFKRHFEESEQDKTLKDRLKTDENLSGIFNWCIEGLNKYKTDGLEPPDSVKDATQEYRENSDKIKLFMSECLIPDEKKAVEIKNVYEAYQRWCHQNGYCAESKRSFTEDLKINHLYTASGTIRGITKRNIIKGYELDESYLSDFESDTRNQSPF